MLNVLFSTITAFDVECDFVVENWDADVSGNVCKTKNVGVAGKDLTVTSINDQTRSYYHSHDVKMLRIEKQTVHYLPRGFGNFFPNIVGVYISESKLKSISKKDLKQFSNLLHFSAVDNDLQTIDADLFVFTPNITQISFSRNNLRAVGTNVFSRLENLTSSKIVVA